MRKLLVIIAGAGIALLGAGSLAVAHELPGKGCEHAREGANKHCGDHHVASRDNGDPDGDGVATTHRVARDNCPAAYNPQQADVDGDGIGNVCDHAADGSDAGGGCDLDPELCGEPDTRIDDDADDPRYANDTDGDGLGDEAEDGLDRP